MKKMRLEDFRGDTSGVMVSGGNGTPAGYMDGAESYLSSVLQKSLDLSIFSRELKAAVKDWPSLYHLSPYRTTIMDCLGLRSGTARVLELGAGCGAVTRWLGEKFHHVVAVEGNYQRAKIARQRCRDLSSVNVYGANFLDLDLKGRFDIATLVGVLEYSHLYHPLFRNDPDGAAFSILNMVFESLADRGILVLALENRLGLKYFSGAREDHSGKIFDGIQGYPSKKSAVTFSAARLEDMIIKAGFSSASFYLPFPDYKLASTIFRGDRLSRDYFLHNWIETPFPDRSDVRRTLLFNESLVMREVGRAGLLRDIANAFLIVATKGEKTAVQDVLFSGDEDWIARHYSLGRHTPFHKIATLRQIQPGELIIENASPHACAEPEHAVDSCFIHRFTREQYCRGDQLIYQVFEMLASGRFETDFINIVRQLNSYLLERYATGEKDAEGIPLLRGDALDALFWNIIITDGTGEWTCIDREWSFEGSLPADIILWRNLYHLLMRYHRYIEDAITDQMKHDFIMACLRAIYPAFNEVRYAQAQRVDDYFQDYAHHGIAADRASLQGSYKGGLKVESGTGEKNDAPAYISAAGSHTAGPWKQGRDTIKELVSIIIPVFNKMEYTQNCLENIALNTSYDPYEVIIVDNGSSDGTKDLLRGIKGDVTTITNKENLGFAMACNQGARAARGEYLVFLNNDTAPQPDWLENLVKAITARPDVAVVGCKLIYPDKRIQHAGVVFGHCDKGPSVYHIYRGLPHDHRAVNRVREFNAVTAACMLVKSSIFFETGMFDEGFRNGYEDIDFCLRIRQQGMKILYTPDSVLYHHEETTEGRRSHGEHNTRYFLQKWSKRIVSDDREKACEDGFRIECPSGTEVQLIPIEVQEVEKTPPHPGNECGLKHAAASGKKKIAIVRGANLNKWEMQNYEPLADKYDLIAYTTKGHMYDTGTVKLPVREVPSRSQGLLLEMEGLEEHLADMDLVFSADITYRFSAQAVMAKQKYGTRVVCLEWENIPFNYEEHQAVGAIKETVRYGADHFIAVTERAKEALMLEGVPSGKIDVVPMGVDLTVFRPDERYVETDRERLRIGRNDIVILCIGRMVWEKGIYDYLHAAATIMRDPALKDCPVKFLVVGKGQELQGVHERAARLSLGDTFVLREEYPYQQICRLHNLCDIFVLPSIATKTWQEQFGMVLIESMACGKPVISTLSGSIPEVVGDAGILVQPNDHLSLYKAAKQLMLDRELRAELGRRALERARERYDSRKTAERIGQIFEKVLCRCSDKEDPDGMYEEGMATWNRGHRLRGFDTVRKAFFMDPDRADVIDSLVRMGMELKRYETVEKALREYLSYHPVNFDALISLSEVLVCLGRTRDAEEELRKVFIFNKEHRRACELRDRLSSISPAQNTPV